MRQLLYVSQSAQPMTAAQLDELLLHSRQYNAAHGVTGVLIYLYDRFVQCIEGDSAEIEGLWANVQNDSRHHSLFVLRDLTVDQRSFPGWTMGFQHLTKDETITEGSFDIQALRDLKHIKALDQTLFKLMAGFYRST